MAGIKISALPSVPSAQLTDLFPAVQSGVTYKESNQQLLTLFQAQATRESYRYRSRRNHENNGARSSLRHREHLPGASAQSCATSPLYIHQPP